MPTTDRIGILIVCAVLGACSTMAPSPSQPAAAAAAAAPSDASSAPVRTDEYGPVRMVRSRDGSYDGEIIGTPVPNGKLSRLAIGMTFEEVTSLIGGPDRMVRHETGKRWIPFYFGSDAQRLQVLYRGEGCLTFTGGNVFGGGGNALMRITATPIESCTD